MGSTSDTFEFDLSIKDQNKFSKREVLSIIERIFDPWLYLVPLSGSHSYNSENIPAGSLSNTISQG